MTVHIVRLGSPRLDGEGLRIGTVRRPPRGVPKAQFASQNWYDVWFPVLAPSDQTLKLGRTADTPVRWRAFARKYRTEMSQAGPSQALDLLAALSHRTNFSVGCYCTDEPRCHRSLLRELLLRRGADLACVPLYRTGQASKKIQRPTDYADEVALSAVPSCSISSTSP